MSFRNKLLEYFIFKKFIFILFFCTVVLGFLSYEYNLITIEQSDHHWKLSVVSKYTLTLTSLNLNHSSVKRAGYHKQDTLLSQTPHREDTHKVKKEVNILLWSNIYRTNYNISAVERDYFPAYGESKFSCPVNYRFYSDRNSSRRYEAILVHVSQANDLPIIYHKTPWILEYDETPLVYPSLSDPYFMTLFSYSLGYRRDADFFNPKVQRPKKRASRALLTHPYDYAASVHSNCEKARTLYLKEFLKHFKVWFYGDCLKNVENSSLVRKSNYGHRQSKLNILKHFKFTLAFMSQDCQDYIDEQLFEAWDAGSLPVFMGTKSIKHLLPSYLKDSVIQVGDFSDPKSLGHYLNTLLENTEYYKELVKINEPISYHNESSPLFKVWYPKYSLGCQIALKVLNITEPNLNYLRPIKCSPRSIHQWLGTTKDNINEKPTTR